ncbi:MAG TPA: adenosine deaminase [Amycolatopsis sp.]|jgi:adenosine deaminase|nr:adenosine deaminase [Amycolatopsis sp.]
MTTASAVAATSPRSLSALPKAHLHLHLEGAMRPATLAELARDYGVEVPATRGYGSFTEFVGQYRAACAVLRTPEDLRRLVREVVEDAAAAGAVWVEPQFYPLHHTAMVGSPAEAIALVVEAGQAAAAEFGIGFGAMVSADRTCDVDEALVLARLAADHAGAGVVAFGLANDESGYPPEPFAKAFATAVEAGLISAPHAGELAGAESVRGALQLLHARRIGHGVRAIEDPELVHRLADSEVCLDVCPTSNVMLSVVGSLAEHPLPRLLAAGVRCSINGDDPLLFGPGLLEEYEIARTRLGLDDVALARVARCSVEASGAPAPLVATAVAAIDAWLSGESAPVA